jgi:glucose-6-phosphate 1-dehydrogenase
MADTLKNHLNHPTAIVIFGGTGDLAETKLLPALLELFVAGALPKRFVIVGLSRKTLTHEVYRKYVGNILSKNSRPQQLDVVENFCSHIQYLAGSFDDANTYVKIKKELSDFDDSIGQCTNKLFYLAVPPQYYESIFSHLSSSQAMKLCDGIDSWARLLVEKPFGKDVVTAAALEEKLCASFTDEQIYRIDHYLAKDAIENIISLRFSNSVLADSWNNERIESIYISLLETKDVSNRGSFYDGIGTLRDVGQNHVLQTLALLTMSPVDITNPKAVRAARAEALENLQSVKLEEVVRGQYSGFKGTSGVEPLSTTETYFKISLVATNPKWEGVRIVLEAGKALAESKNEVIVTFKPAELCHCAAEATPHEHRNVLRISFSPEQVLSLSLWLKHPGFVFCLQKQELEFMREPSADNYSPQAYERVLFDCIIGDQTRFVSSPEVKAAWQFITPILDSFKDLPLQEYARGSHGPKTNI